PSAATSTRAPGSPSGSASGSRWQAASSASPSISSAAPARRRPTSHASSPDRAPPGTRRRSSPDSAATPWRSAREPPKPPPAVASAPPAAGPVLFAYDGSDLASYAIEQAAAQLVPGRAALVVCVWQPADVGFVPVGGRHFDALNASEVCDAAEQT